MDLNADELNTISEFLNNFSALSHSLDVVVQRTEMTLGDKTIGSVEHDGSKYVWTVQ